MSNFTIIFFLTVSLFAQSKNADIILNRVKQKFELVKDYSVNLNIEIDMEFLRVPSVKAKAFFKQPDKMKIESNDFAVLPKEGMDFSPSKLLKHKYSAIYVKTDTLNNSIVDVIKIIPLEDSVKIVLSTLWIDDKKEIIKKIETTTKNRGSYQVNFYYGKMEKYGLPQKMIFTFSGDKDKIQKSLENNNTIIKKPVGNINKKFSGNIIVRYSNYKINQGLEDNFFENKKE